MEWGARMNDGELKSLYTLENHLEEKCKFDEAYIDLYSTWKLNKKTLKQILKTIIFNYPHFTEHDDNHSNTIITNIEMLLGEERIKTLSATDTWMILQCAYLHDFGMAILYKKVEEVWQSQEFKDYIEEKKSYDLVIKEAAEYIENMGIKLQNKEEEVIWPLKIKKYVTRIIADYFRTKHAELTKEYLNILINEWNIDLSHNNLIKTRLLKSIAQISFIHTQNFDEVMKLDFESNGFRSDYFHPRFIAEMLRMGDLLDLDNGRYNDYVKNVVGDIPKSSEVHIEKHNSVSQLLIMPQLIEVKADCKDKEVYKETRNWFNWLEDEIKDLTLNWTNIIPKNLPGYAPKFIKSIYYKGDEDFNNLVDLRFQISQEKAFDVIEGSGIYEDEFVFMREFIQNALDATKIQLWRDIKSGIYDPWIKKGIDKNKLNPFDIKQEIYRNYEIKIEVVKKFDKCFEVIIKDKGTGISLDTLKSMSEVGKSYKERKNIKREINEMPSWLKPTGGFGIGIQSGFLMNEQFKAYSKLNSMDSTIEIVFESRKKDGYIQVTNSEHIMKRGTEFHIEINKETFKYNYGGYVSKYINSSYDPIQDDELLAYKILDSAIEYCRSILIPVSITYNETNINLTDDILEAREFDNEDKRYYYKISDALDEIQIWDKETYSYIKFTIDYKSIKYSSILNYKGIAVDEELRFRNKMLWIRSFIDVFGFDTKQMLKLNRNKFTNYGLEAIEEIHYKALCFYMKIISEKLENIKGHNDNIGLAYLLLAPKFEVNVDNSKTKYLIEDSKYYVDVIEKQEEEFKKVSKKISDIIELYPNLTYVNIDDFIVYKQFERDSYRIKEILNALNKHSEEINDNIIIVDKEFIKNILIDYKVSYIKYIKINNDENLIIYRINKDSGNLAIETDDYTKNEFIKRLVSGKEQSHKLVSISELPRERSCIPVISGYEDLAVKYIPFGISVVQDKVNWIISPMKRVDNQFIGKFDSCNDFINSIVKREDYNKLLDFVYKNRLGDNQISKDDIDRLYKKLIEEYYNLEKQK
ncbi:hypothetical protein FC839_05195 [Clostridium botulinum]|uniref:HD-CE domain-containing protein n=2 Tax=Clostridium botulinum TaxID=1491 RepID=A0A6B4JK45_CLOBO|nr:hypothetical protein [Clostridium botulinum]NFL52068.1 hypothetical protein [Clostridium botulinum]NFS13109.1 hypothetical protein [Clostridium botulinum]NFV24926.1 hypothetical protein [Clostridium botulinum]